MPINMNGTKTERVEVTEKFIHKLKCKFPKIIIETIDERLTTVAAHNYVDFTNLIDYFTNGLMIITYDQQKQAPEIQSFLYPVFQEGVSYLWINKKI